MHFIEPSRSILPALTNEYHITGSLRNPSARYLRLPALKSPPKSIKFKAGDHYALRTPQGRYNFKNNNFVSVHTRNSSKSFRVSK